MEVLRAHRRNIVAGKPPYEIEMGCYYAYALRALVADADHERSLRPDRITDAANHRLIGFNPFFDPFVFRNGEELRRFTKANASASVDRQYRLAGRWSEPMAGGEVWREAGPVVAQAACISRWMLPAA